jgi:hypothetical protein
MMNTLRSPMLYRLILAALLLVMAACSLSAPVEQATPTLGPPPFTGVPTSDTALAANVQTTATPLATAQLPTAIPTAALPTVVPTVAISGPLPPTVPAINTAYTPVDPNVRAIALSTTGGLRWGEIELPGYAATIDYNPVYPESYARTDNVGMLKFAPPGGGEGVYSFSPYFDGFGAASAEENRLFVAEVAWSPNGQMLAFRIDSKGKEINDGVWFWQPARELPTDPSYQLLRDCPPGCDLVIRQNANEWRSLSIDWSSDNQAILVQLELPLEGRRALTVVQAVRDPETTQSRTGPNVLRYDYGTWANDGQRIVVSGKNPDGQVVFGMVNRDGSNASVTTAASIGLGWVQNAVHQPSSGQIIMLGAPGGSGGALRLYDSTGAALTDFIGNGPPQRVVWSPDRSAVLVTTDEGGTFRHYVARIDGVISDITDVIGTTQAVGWVKSGLPANARSPQPYIPSGVIAGSKYQPGQQLRVYADDGLNIHTEPSLNASTVGAVGRGEYVAILAGPVEADGIIWWRVQTVSSSGWIGGQIDGTVTLGP